jgi:hypothetical protein
MRKEQGAVFSREAIGTVSVAVYNAGTAVLATIYSDNGSPPTPQANPFNADSLGRWFFYVANGRYDIEFSGSNIGTYKLTDVLIEEASIGTDAAKIQGKTVDTTARADDTILVYKSATETYVHEAKGSAAAHHLTHENGAGDEISVADLSGLLADAQTPLAHKTSHENTGGDEISVAGLSGVLADRQDANKIQGHTVDEGAIGDDKILVYKTASGTFVYEAKSAPAAHKASHEDAGLDEISLTNLSGLPADCVITAGRAGGQIIYGGTGSGDDFEIYSTFHETKGDIKLKDNTIFKRLYGEAVPASPTGSLLYLQLGTALAPLADGHNDMPIYIEHHVSSTGGGLSYAVWIKTSADVTDTGAGLMVENEGFADGATFVIAAGNSNVGASAFAAFQNHTLDVHEQYVLSLASCHGRTILAQSLGTGETLEIWRVANNAGTAKSGSHILINENLGAYGHLQGFQFVGNSSGSDDDIIFDIKKGATDKYLVYQDGDIKTSGSLTLAKDTPDAGYIFFGSDGNDYMMLSSSWYYYVFGGAAKIIYDNAGNQTLYGALYTGGASPLQVVGARQTGWAAPGGASSKATFDPSTVTLPQLGERVHAVIDDLMTHGLLGT